MVMAIAMTIMMMMVLRMVRVRVEMRCMERGRSGVYIIRCDHPPTYPPTHSRPTISFAK